MKPVTFEKSGQLIVYDADVLPSADAGLFDADAWRAQGRVEGEAPGRGTSCFLDTPFGAAVLRHYLRGGWAARFSRDQYLFTGNERSRPWREFHLLRRMNEAGLNVPAPLAALVQRSGFCYRGALLTRRVEPARPLAELCESPGLDWARLGRELRVFFDAGVRHADLNARNILIHGDTGAAWLLDFDRSAFTPGAGVNGTVQLARLRRSLDKTWGALAAQYGSKWQDLMGGYRAAS
jgi:3-deoxy-D-manno-octulosonic acid kinase